MAIDHELKGYGDSYYQYTPFESSKGNIKIELDAGKEEDVYIILNLIFMHDGGSGSSRAVRRIVNIEREDFSKDKLGTILRKLMFKW